MVHPRRPKAYLSHIRSKIEINDGSGSIFPHLSICDLVPPNGSKRRTSFAMDTYNNVPAAFPDPDSLQEFSMLQNSYSAVYGRNVGVVVNMITKSGTNEFHGDAWEFFRNDKLDAADFFNNAAGIGRGEFRQNQFGFTAGGPIKRNKTFIFGDCANSSLSSLAIW